MCYNFKGAMEEGDKWSAVLDDFDKHPPQEAILGMVDVLGFKEFVEQKQDQAIRSYIEIVDNLKVILKITNSTTHMEILSDTFLVYSYEESAESLLKIAAIIENIRYNFLIKEGLLSRGAIVKGKMYNTSDRKFYDPHTKKEIKIDDGIIVSEALVKAARLEKKAYYPRIVVEEEVKMLFDQLTETNPTVEINGYPIKDFFVEESYGGEKYYTINFFRNLPQIVYFLQREHCGPDECRRTLEEIRSGIDKYKTNYYRKKMSTVEKETAKDIIPEVKSEQEKIQERFDYLVDKYNKLIEKICAEKSKNPFIDKEIISQIEKLHYDANQL